MVEERRVLEDVTTLDYVWHHGAPIVPSDGRLPRTIMSGSGIHVTDAEGRRLIDGTSGQAVVQVGHGRQEIADAISVQARQLAFSPLAFGFTHPRAAELASRLAQITPGRLTKTFLCSTGSEAVDTAIKMARQYQRRIGAGGRYKVIARRGGYHGVTFGALSATHGARLRAPNEPLVPGFRHVAQPYQTRCRLCRTEPACSLACARDLEDAIVAEGPETVAAFIAEPVATPETIKVPPDEYWGLIQATCRRYGIVLIVDEVFTGFGRTGRLFASEHWGIEPDIMTMSKGLSSGYVPIAGAIATDEVAGVFGQESDSAFQHAGTYSGHPVGCAAALANLDIFDREGVVANARQVGEHLRSALAPLERHPIVLSVNAIGMLIGIELAADRESRRPVDPALGAAIEQQAYEMGLICRYRPYSLYLYPPLVLTTDQANEIAFIVDRAIEAATR